MVVFKLCSQPYTQLRTFQGHRTTGHWLPLNWCQWQGMWNNTLYPLCVMCLCAKLLQSCLILWDPMDYSPPGFSVHGDSPGKKAGMGCHALLQCILPTEGRNPWLLHYRWILYRWAIREARVLYSFQSLSRVWLFVTPWNAAHQASLSITNTRSLLKRMSIESVMPSNHLILSSTSPPAFNLSQDKDLFQWVSSSCQVTKVLKFQLQHQSFQWIFRTDFL